MLKIICTFSKIALDFSKIMSISCDLELVAI